MKFHFVTGLHRAGTHSIAKDLSYNLGLPFVEESFIGLHDLDNAIRLKEGRIKKIDLRTGKEKYIHRPGLKNGFVCQCPFLAHKALELSNHGRVYWCKRNPLDVVTSMRNGSFDLFSWKIMNSFHDEFPDDSIWSTLEYDGKIDVYDGFINHYALLLRVKDHFLNTHFKDAVKIMELEKMPFYDKTVTLSNKKPLKAVEFRRLKL